MGWAERAERPIQAASTLALAPSLLPSHQSPSNHPHPPSTQVPVFFVVTKVDLAPEHVTKHTLATLAAILKKPGVRKRPFLVRAAGCLGGCGQAGAAAERRGLFCACPVHATTHGQCPAHPFHETSPNPAPQVRDVGDVLTCARHMHADSLAPIFLTSSVTGQGLDLVRWVGGAPAGGLLGC